MSNENKGNNFWDNVKNISLILSLTLSVFAIFLNVFAVPSAINKFLAEIKKFFSPEQVQFWINIGNITASLYFLSVFLRKKKISIYYYIKSGDKEHDFCELAEVEGYKGRKEEIPAGVKKTLAGYEKRVEGLITQYLWTVRFFAISLVFVYLSIIFTPVSDTEAEEGYRLLTNFAIATNLINFWGGVIVFLGFWVLYNETLNKQEKDNRFWVIPSVLAAIYTMLFIYLSWLFKPDDNAYKFLNRFDLVAGSVNGLAMFLLFGRYVSLEQSLRGTDLFKRAFRNLFKPLPLFKSERSYTKIVSFGIIFLLPIYALAQPQFGALEIPLYGDPKIFQTTVYGICLVGKICFFHLTYLLLSRGLLHLYLYGLVAEIGNFRKLEECLTTVPRKPDA